MIKEYNHSAFALHYELVLVSKNKQKIFRKEIAEFSIDTFKKIADNYQVKFLDVHYEEDHLHFKFECYPTTNLSKFINAFKSASSRKIKNNYEDIREMLNSGAVWEAQYFLMTVGIEAEDLVLHYLDKIIRCDELHHQHKIDCDD